MSDAPVSTQNDFAGQQGWNDCLPESMAQGQRARGAPRKVRRADDGGLYSGQPPAVSKPPSSVSGPPPSAPPQRAPSGPGLPPPRASGEPRPVDAPPATEAAVDAEHISERIAKLLESSTLSSKETAQYKAKFEKTVPELEAVHLRAIASALDEPARARDILMKHSLVNSGTATWCTPLRRVIESQT